MCAHVQSAESHQECEKQEHDSVVLRKTEIQYGRHGECTACVAGWKGEILFPVNQELEFRDDVIGADSCNHPLDEQIIDQQTANQG